ncbi:MAG: TonB-dependent receptor [Blastocatellia bacterium]|nr:TonB-dependent receptor [Blastocatellia bacterium]
MTAHFKKLLLWGILPLCFTGLTLAQSTFSTIVGTARDTSGAVIGGATVTVKLENAGFSRTATTDETGDFTVPGLPPGRYRVKVTAEGFKQSVAAGIEVKSNLVVRVNLALEVGPSAEIVNVNATGSLLQSGNGIVSHARSGSDLTTLPQNFRAANGSIINFFALVPGVILDDGNQGLSINGSRRSQNEISLDGIQVVSTRFNNTIPSFFPSAEIVGEVRISTNNAAEFGAPGTVVTTSQSGTNLFHGGVFEYHQNSATNARDFFARSRPFLIAHTFGGVFSGPLRKDKTHFFVDGEFNRITNQAVFNTNVPSDAFRTGDFSALSSQLKNPFTGSPFPGNRIPANLLNATTLAVQNQFYPRANQTGTANFAALGPQKLGYDGFDVRLDQNFSARHFLFGRFTFKNGFDHTQSGRLPTIGQNNNQDKVRGLTVSDTYTFSPRFLNEFRFGISSHEAVFAGPFIGAEAVSRLGIQGLFFSQTDKPGLPAFTVVGFEDISQVAAERIREGNLQFSDFVTWTKGKHTVKGGVDFRRYRSADVPIFSIGGEDFGTFSFDGRFTGNAYADFLLGLPNRSTRLTLPPDYKGHGHEVSAFVQDDWRLTPRLTVNVGLRYGYVGPFRLSAGSLTNFNPATGHVVVVDTASLAQTSPVFKASIGNTQIVTADQEGLSDALRNSDKNDFAPRLGFAYRFSDTGRTVLRGGFGVFHNRVLGRVFHSLTGVHSSSAEVFNNSISGGKPAFSFPRPFPAGFQTGSLDYRTAVATNLRTPYTMQWNVSLERELVPDLAVRVSYIGNRSNKLIVSPNINQIAPSTLPFSLTRAPFPNFQRVFIRDNGAIAAYHSLQVELEQRLRHGLAFQTSYVWARNLTDGGDTDEAGPRLENYFSRASEKSDVTFSRRHRFLTTLTYELPFGANRRYFTTGIAKHVLGGWSVATVLIFQTGRFFTPTFSGSDPSNTNTFGGRADRLANGNLDGAARTIFRWFDTRAFAAPPAGSGRFGTSAPNVLVGPPTKVVNLGLRKIIFSREHVRIQFQATATNVINTANFDVPNANISSPLAGQITRTQGGDAGPRTWQFAFRVDF